MSKPDHHPARRLERLERVLAGRRARLAATLARRRGPVPAPGAMGTLQRYGYPAAALLALTAVMPTVVRFALRRRELLLGAAANAMGIRKLRKRVDVARAESDW